MTFIEEIPVKTFETETKKVKFSGHRVSRRRKVEKGVPVVVTYHPSTQIHWRKFL